MEGGRTRARLASSGHSGLGANLGRHRDAARPVPGALPSGGAAIRKRLGNAARLDATTRSAVDAARRHKARRSTSRAARRGPTDRRQRPEGPRLVSTHVAFLGFNLLSTIFVAERLGCRARVKAARGELDPEADDPATHLVGCLV